MKNRFLADLVIDFSKEETLFAFSLYDGKQIHNITYKQFSDDIFQAAGYFKKKNIYKQHIALMAPNSYEWMLIFFAITSSGNIPVLLNPDLPPELLYQHCKMADVTIICLNSNDSELTSSFKDITLLPFTTIRSSSPLLVDEIYVTNSNETALLLFTSGTTGQSKVVELTASNLFYGSNDICRALEELQTETALSIIPFFHIAAFRGILAMLQLKRSILMGRGIKYIFMDLAALNPDGLLMVPSIAETLVKLLAHKTDINERQKITGTKLRTIFLGGATIKPDIVRSLIDLGFKINIAYGLTETTAAGMHYTVDNEHLNALGKISDYMQCRISDGELLLKGPSIMKGYYKDPKSTADILQDGWLHSGDLGYCTQDGYYYINGRKKNVIILSNGENVNPEEIEAVFSECSCILESIVYSDGKGICTDIYTDNCITAKNFIIRYNASVPLYRQVYKVNYFNTPLEKTSSGKIKRKENIYD